VTAPANKHGDGADKSVRITGARRVLLHGFDPYTDTAITQRHLPHWTQPGVTYFITFRLGDSIPLDLQRQWQAEREAWLRHHPEPWEATVEAEYHARFTREQDEWLDAGMGECHLRRRDIRSQVEMNLAHFNGQRHDLDAYVLMPNHVHALLIPRDGQSVFELLKGIKGVSARWCNQLLDRTGETFWMEDSYNRIVRDAEELWAKRRYIEQNPTIARLRPDEFTLVMNEALYVEP